MMKKYLLFFSLFTLIWIGLKVDTQLFFSSSSDCPFCTEEILKRQTFFEEEGILGILTHKPIVPGHILIIPKRHVERFENLTEEEILHMGAAIKKIDAIVKKTYGTTGYLLLQKNGKEVGQSVPHVHFHYLPRKEGESSAFLALRFSIRNCLKPLNIKSIDSIRSALQRAERES